MQQLKALRLLEKLKQAQIDQIVPIVQQLAQEYTEINTKIEALLVQAEEEKQQLYTAGKATDHATFGRYYSGVLTKVEKLKQQLLEVEEKLQLVREGLRKHFTTAKRYQIAAKNIEQRQQTAAEKKLMDMLDDLAQRRHQN